MEKTSPIVDPRELEIDAEQAALGQSRGNQDAVESALAKALDGGTAAGRFDVAAILAGEQQARRLARERRLAVVTAPVRGGR